MKSKHFHHVSENRLFKCWPALYRKGTCSQYHCQGKTPLLHSSTSFPNPQLLDKMNNVGWRGGWKGGLFVNWGYLDTVTNIEPHDTNIKSSLSKHKYILPGLRVYSNTWSCSLASFFFFGKTRVKTPRVLEQDMHVSFCSYSKALFLGE